MNQKEKEIHRMRMRVHKRGLMKTKKYGILRGGKRVKKEFQVAASPHSNQRDQYQNRVPGGDGMDLFWVWFFRGLSHDSSVVQCRPLEGRPESQQKANQRIHWLLLAEVGSTSVSDSLSLM